MTDWKPLTESAKTIGISTAKLSKMVKAGRVKSKKDPRDERLTLVDMDELRSLFFPKETQ